MGSWGLTKSSIKIKDVDYLLHQSAKISSQNIMEWRSTSNILWYLCILEFQNFFLMVGDWICQITGLMIFVQSPKREAKLWNSMNISFWPWVFYKYIYIFNYSIFSIIIIYVDRDCLFFPTNKLLLQLQGKRKYFNLITLVWLLLL